MHMPNSPSRKLLAISFSLLAVLAFGLAATRAQAQTPNCGGAAGCVSSSDFTLGADGWESSYGGIVPTVDVGWLNYKSFGVLFWQSEAYGVLTMTTNANYDYYNADQRSGIRKTFWLEPGRYQVAVRIAGDRPASSVVYYTVDAFGSLRTAKILNFPQGIGNVGWTEIETTETEATSFTIETVGDVSIVLTADQYSTIYLDYVYLIRLSDVTPYPSATPGPGTPSATPGPPTATSTPIPPQATPVPAATAYCQPKPTAGLPAYTPTYGVRWSYFEGFDNALTGVNNFWATMGEGVSIVYNVGHRALNAGGIPNSADPGGGSMDRPALIYRPTTPLTGTVYVDVWSTASFVAAGVTQQLEVWVEDAGYAGGAYWTKMDDVTVSHRTWYPAHWEISPPTGGDYSGVISAIAFVAKRSDGAALEKVYLDDVSLYNHLTMAPYCDGTFPDGTEIVGPERDNGIDDDVYFINVPVGRDCPGDIMRPNNFWGMLLAGVTMFLDNQTALSPGHTPGTTRDLATQYVMSPLGGVVILASIILDWNIPITMIKIYFVFQIGLGVVGIWKLIRRTFIV
jgi:hypothetical protein